MLAKLLMESHTAVGTDPGTTDHTASTHPANGYAGLKSPSGQASMPKLFKGSTFAGQQPKNVEIVIFDTKYARPHHCSCTSLVLLSCVLVCNLRMSCASLRVCTWQLQAKILLNLSLHWPHTAALQELRFICRQFHHYEDENSCCQTSALARHYQVAMGTK